MRRLTLLTALVLALLLAACRASSAPEPSAPPDVPPSTGDAPVSLALDALDVELAVDGRDADALLDLQKAFPAALTDALAKQKVTVGAVNLTFGASGEATLSALRLGTVQLAFLPAEDGFAYRNGAFVAVEQGRDGDLGRSVLVLGFSEPHLADALRAALPDLAPTLADYAGAYDTDEAAIAALREAFEEQTNDSP